MPIHIANPEVESLVERYQKRLGTTKTDAIRQALEFALRQPRTAKRAELAAFGYDVIRRAREKRCKPFTKEESDELYEYLDKGAE